jgi:hypothetical protein
MGICGGFYVHLQEKFIAWRLPKNFSGFHMRVLTVGGEVKYSNVDG